MATMGPCHKTQEVSPQFSITLAFVTVIAKFFFPHFLTFLSKLLP